MDNVEFTYEYHKRNGHPVPKTTVAMIPVPSKTRGFRVAMGWSWCSRRDNPNKRKGRSIAHARALGVIEHENEIIKTRQGATIGIVLFPTHVTADYMSRHFGFNLQTAERLAFSAQHLVKLHNAAK